MSQKEPRRIDRFWDFVLTRLAQKKSVKRIKLELGANEDLPKPINEESPYRSLFRRCQKDIGISRAEILDVSVEESNEQEPDALARTTNSQIIVTRNNFAKLKYGTQRITALHESFHNKFNDNVFKKWALPKISIASIASTVICSAALILRMRKATSQLVRISGYILSPIVSIIASSLTFGKMINFFTSEKFENYKEFRADKEAVKHSKCHMCLQEFSDEICHNENSRYMTKSDVKYYINLFELQNLLCEHHRNM